VADNFIAHVYFRVFKADLKHEVMPCEKLRTKKNPSL
jgi:hypothetical protein